MARDYKIELLDRGEEYSYTSGTITLTLFRTYCAGHRLFCEGTVDAPGGRKFSFDERRTIIEDICDYFETTFHPTILVIDEDDEHFDLLVSLIETLNAAGHLLEVEVDSAGKRDKARDKMYLDILKSGKQLSTDGLEIADEAGYRQWKRRGGV